MKCPTCGKSYKKSVYHYKNHLATHSGGHIRGGHIRGGLADIGGSYIKAPAGIIGDLNTLNGWSKNSIGLGFDVFGPTCIGKGIIHPQATAIGLQQIITNSHFPTDPIEQQQLDAIGGSITAGLSAAAAVALPFIAKKLASWVAGKAVSYAADKAGDYAKTATTGLVKRGAKTLWNKVTGQGYTEAAPWEEIDYIEGNGFGEIKLDSRRLTPLSW